MQALSRFVLVHALILVGWGCASARPNQPLPAPTGVVLSASEPAQEQQAVEQEAASGPASQPTVSPEQRLAELRRRLEQELAAPELEKARVSLVVAPAGGGDALFELEPEARRVPASNAKLLTSVAALRALPGRHSFVTEYSVRGSRLHIWGNGDPGLRGRELLGLGRQLQARGLGRVSGVVVDDSHFDRARLAPGFQSFGEGAYYRPTSGALSVNGNAITIKVTAPRDRKRPRVDVYPPSDYVKVRKLVRYLPKRSKKNTAIKVNIRPRGSIMWVTVSGLMRRGERPWRTRRAVYDPGLATGWAVRRALVKAGVAVSGSVWRGRRPKGARLLLRRTRPLGVVLARVNTHSDNLAAEHLVRAMGSLAGDTGRRAGSWTGGLAVLQKALEELGLSEFWLGNGSGLHRKSWVTARTMVALLQRVFGDERLRRALVPTLAVAGRSGTLAQRMRRTAAEGLVHAKTGTLAGALALSGLVDPDGPSPLAFSLLVNGRSDNQVRDRMDRIGVLLASYAAGRPLVEEPASQPASQPASAPASQPADAGEEEQEEP